MKHLIIVALLIMVLGCQNFESGLITEPDKLQQQETEIQTLDSRLVLGDHSYRTALTTGGRELILAELKRAGHVVTSEELDVLLEVMDVAAPIIASLSEEIPLSLKDATGDRAEIIGQDPAAAAFALKVKSAIEGKLTTEIPPTVLRCDTGIGLAVVLCLKTLDSNCKLNRDEPCVSLSNIIDTISCIWDMCHIDQP